MNDFRLYRHAWISAPHFDRQLSDSECDDMLSKGGWMVRNTYDFDQKEESDFWYIIKDSFGGMEEHTSNERRKIRKSQRNYVFRIIDRKLVEEHGFDIMKRVFDGYPVKDRDMNKKVFNELFNSWKGDDFEFWGAFDIKTEELVGFIVVQLYDDACFYDHMMVLPEFKHNASYPFYGFLYTLNEYYLGYKKFKYVTDGSRSMTEHSNVQPFLEQNFKFRKAYCKLKIRYKWWFGAIVKMLYPFRKLIKNRNVRGVLLMEGIRVRSEE